METKTIWYYKPTNRYFYCRKEAKEYLGGTNAFNKALKNKDIRYIETD